MSLKPTLVLFLLIAVIISILYQFNWSGFGEDSNKSKSIEKTIKDGTIISLKETEIEHFESAKTLWDWLGLASNLAIPIVLFQFQVNEQKKADKRVNVEKEQAKELAKVEKEQAEKREKFEKDIAEANLREEAFHTYINQMSEILINKTSRSELFSDGNRTTNHIYKDNFVLEVARVRTVTILRRLENDVERQNRILDFLKDTGLTRFLFITGNLSGVNLSGVNLNGANLNGANLSGVNLSGANLSNANLSDSNFSDANLSGANLKNSNIINTKFINTNLSNAILISTITFDEEVLELNYKQIYVEDDEFSPGYQTDIWFETDFSGVKLTNTDLKYSNLKSAKNLIPEQLKAAINWDKAQYNDELFNQLGLPKSLKKLKSEGIEIEQFIDYPIEVRDYIDEETETITQGKITGFSISNHRVNVKVLSGQQLDDLCLDDVYVYQNPHC